MKVGGRTQSLGTYTDEEDAAHTFDQAIWKYDLDRSQLNFPDEEDGGGASSSNSDDDDEEDKEEEQQQKDKVKSGRMAGQTSSAGSRKLRDRKKPGPSRSRGEPMFADQ